MNPNRLTSRHIIKIGKVKVRILKAAREKQRVNYKGILIRLSVDFSTETVQHRRGCHDIHKVLKRKSLQPGILYSARLSFRIEDKEFLDKQK